MKKISLKSGIERIYLGAMRFPLTLVFVFGLAICLFLEINGHNVKIQESYWTLLGLGIPLSLSAALFTEDLKNKFLHAVHCFNSIDSGEILMRIVV